MAAKTRRRPSTPKSKATAPAKQKPLTKFQKMLKAKAEARAKANSVLSTAERAVIAKAGLAFTKKPLKANGDYSKGQNTVLKAAKREDFARMLKVISSTPAGKAVLKAAAKA